MNSLVAIIAFSLAEQDWLLLGLIYARSLPISPFPDRQGEDGNGRPRLNLH
jgi:hypothetical protein